MPAASSVFRTECRVASRTKSRSDSSRFNAVSATRALSASSSCVQPKSARAARIGREVTIHDHLPKPRTTRHSYDFSTRSRAAAIWRPAPHQLR